MKKSEKDQKLQEALDDQRRQIKAAERLLLAQEAQTDLIRFTELMMPDREHEEDASQSEYKAAMHHRVIAASLQEVEAGRYKRMIYTMPPGSGKSELASKKFIPWILGKKPNRKVIFAAYNEGFSEDTGRAVRDVMNSPMYKQVFPGCKEDASALKAAAQSASRIETTQGGMAVFVGAAGTITGRRADIMVIDDPIKDNNQINSPTEREKLWKWFTTVVHSRLMSDQSCVIIIMTRWHEDDLVGRLIDPNNDHYIPEEAAKWKILQLPALALDDDPLGRKVGESIWPERFSVEYLESSRRLDPQTFNALYQGRPMAEEGNFFKKDWILKYKPGELPNNLRIYVGSDHAVSTRERADFTCLLPVGVDERGDIWVLPDVWWQKKDTADVVDAFIDIIRRHRPIFWWAEKGHITQSIGPFLRARMMEENQYATIVEMTPSKDKMTRAQAIMARMCMGRVHFPAFAPWIADAEHQLLSFPSGKHDDFVDALSWIGIGLAMQSPASSGIPKKEIDARPGTLRWIKEASKYEAKKRQLAMRDGY